MIAIAKTLVVSCANMIERVKGNTKPRRRYHKAQDAAIVPLIRDLVARRPTYGYRRIAAILNRLLRHECQRLVNHKRVYRIMQVHQLLLARRYTERPDLPHNGKVIVMRSNLRWCSDGFEFTCWNGSSLGLHLSSMRMIARLLHGRVSSTAGSAAPTSGI
jgi:transposase InsO family protein